METDLSNVTQVLYTLDPQTYGNLISQYRPPGTPVTKYYLFDAVASTDRLTDASANVTDNYIYQAFGSIVTSSGTTVNPFRYVGSLGYYYDADFLSYYIRARHYDPVTGRWRSADPKRLNAGDLNLYRYARANPINATDPSGEDCPGCDIPLEGLKGRVEKRPCQLACCAEHDACFDKYHCTADSWKTYFACVLSGTYEVGSLLSNCFNCNDAVIDCFIKCQAGNHMVNKPLYYCARKGKYITIGGTESEPPPGTRPDYPNIDAAESACCPKKSKYKPSGHLGRHTRHPW